MLKNVVELERPLMTIQYGARALHSGKVRLHARARAGLRTQKFLHGNNGFVNTPQCYIIRTLPLICFSTYLYTVFPLF